MEQPHLGLRGICQRGRRGDVQEPAPDRAFHPHMRQISGQTIIPQENSLLRMLKVVKRKREPPGMLVEPEFAPYSSRDGDRGIRTENVRSVAACDARPAGECAPRAGGNGTAPRWDVPRHGLPRAGLSSRGEPPGDRATVLGFFRANPAQASGALAMALQALPLPPEGRGAPLSLLRARVSKFDKLLRSVAPSGKGGSV